MVIYIYVKQKLIIYFHNKYIPLFTHAYHNVNITNKQRTGIRQYFLHFFFTGKAVLKTQAKITVK